MKRLRILRRWFKRKFGYARLVCLALLVGGAALRVADFAPIEELRLRVFDSYQRIDPRVKAARPVTIVDIDEKSLADPRLGQWPWPRTRIADIVNNLTRIGVAALRIADPAPIEELRVRTFDTFQRIDPRAKMAKPPVAIVDIDEKSLAKLGQCPWPRTRIADMVTNLTRLGAVVIAFDIMFAEPDRLNPDVAADTFRNLDEETRAKLRQLPSNDQIFADAMQHSRVVLGETGLPHVRSELDKTLPVTGLAMLGEDPQRFMFKFPGLLRNTEVLEKAAAGRGLLTINPERDGIVRRVPMIMQAQGTTMPSLSFEMLRVVDRHRHHLHQDRQGRHQEHRRQGIPDSDRPQRPALGSFCASAIPRSMSRPPTCSTAALRPKRSRASWC